MSTSNRPIFTIGALGDSITTAFNAEKPGDNATLSWSTGSESDGHALRLSKLLPHLDVRTINAAVAGSRARDLEAQVDRLLRDIPNNVTLDYVTLLVGANDLPQWLVGETGLALDAFVADVRGAVERLIAANPRVMILLVAVPDQSLVLQHIIPNIEPLRRAYRVQWRRLNQALAELATRASANVRFSASPAASAIPVTHLSSLDRYHPSAAGQRALAALTWRDGFFPS